MSVKPPESFIRGGERTGSNYTPSSLLCDCACLCVCVCRGLWGVGGDGGGGGEGREEVNTRSGMTQLCGGLACNTHRLCVCVCVCELMRQSQPRLFSPIREKNKSKLFCLIIHSHSHRLFLFLPCFASSLLASLSVLDLVFDLSWFTCCVCLWIPSGVALDWYYIGTLLKICIIQFCYEKIM